MTNAATRRFVIGCAVVALAAVAQGKPIGEAYDLASAAIRALSLQVPRIDDDGNCPLVQ